MGRMNSHVRRLVIQHMLPLQGGRCWWCAGMIEEMAFPPTIEHLVPRSLGGGNNIDNIVIACWFCNNTRSADQRWTRHPLMEGTLRATLAGPAIYAAMGIFPDDWRGVPAQHMSHVRTWRDHQLKVAIDREAAAQARSACCESVGTEGTRA